MSIQHAHYLIAVVINRSFSFDKIMSGLNGTHESEISGRAISPTRPLQLSTAGLRLNQNIQFVCRAVVVMCCVLGLPIYPWSFLAHVLPITQIKFGSQDRSATNRALPQLRRKTYVVFQTNEGDTPKIVTGFFGELG